MDKKQKVTQLVPLPVKAEIVPKISMCVFALAVSDQREVGISQKAWEKGGLKERKTRDEERGGSKGKRTMRKF